MHRIATKYRIIERGTIKFKMVYMVRVSDLKKVVAKVKSLFGTRNT